MLSRRELIGKAAVGAAAAMAVGGVVGTAVAATRPLRDSTDEPAGDREESTEATQAVAATGPTAPAPWELVAPLAAGSEIAYGWRLVDLTPVQDGSAVATLENPRGRSHRVHLCANDGTPQGIIYTRRVDLVVMNQGYGDLPTEEHFGQAVAKLAHAVAANEAKVANDVFAAFLPHAERVQRFAAASDASTDGRLR
jgi:hypothetical protein